MSRNARRAALPPGSLQLLIACLTIAASGASADTTSTYTAPDLIVTASRLPTSFQNITRNVTVITREEIASAPVHSIADLLNLVAGVDARQRGPNGVQTDVSMRGGTFEQVLVLVDGVKVTAPQTGHHAMDLAVTLDDVERIEILRGHGSRLFGPNAFGGVINIITRSRAANGLLLSTAYGQHALADASATGTSTIGPTAHRLSVEHRRSDGYRHNTDFDVNILSYGGTTSSKAGRLSVRAGYADRKFGANGFYAGRPDEWEHTTVYSLAATGAGTLGRVALAPRVSWRRHKDDYILDRTNPSLYRNRHTTDAYSAELETSVESAFGATAFGGEVGREEIRSTNLGEHGRTRSGFFVEHRAEPIHRFVLDIGASAYRYSDVGWRFWPGVDLGVSLRRGLRLYGSVGRAFRVPTYTELYYEDPHNKGNPDLKPEDAWSYETGAAWRTAAASADASVFLREGKNLIDYVRNADTLRWEARNITAVTTRGVELNFALDPTALVAGFPVRRIRAGYAFLNSDKATHDFSQSKYVLHYLRHQFTLDITHVLPFRIMQTWKLRYEDRVGSDAFVALDARASRSAGPLEFFLAGTNLFDTAYEDNRGVPLPGRWLQFGVTAHLGGNGTR